MQINIHICITIFSPFPTNQRNAKISKRFDLQKVPKKFQTSGGGMGRADLEETPIQAVFVCMDSLRGKEDASQEA